MKKVVKQNEIDWCVETYSEKKEAWCNYAYQSYEMNLMYHSFPSSFSNHTEIIPACALLFQFANGTLGFTIGYSSIMHNQVSVVKQAVWLGEYYKTVSASV